MITVARDFGSQMNVRSPFWGSSLPSQALEKPSGRHWHNYQGVQERV